MVGSTDYFEEASSRPSYSSITVLNSYPYGSRIFQKFMADISFGLHACKYLVKSVRRSDTVIASYPTPFACLVLLALCKIMSVRFVLDVRDLWPNKATKEWSRLAAFIIRFINKRLYLWSSAVIAASPRLEREIHDVSGVSSIMIPISAPDFYFEKRDRTLPECLKSNERDQTIIIWASFNRSFDYKNLEQLFLLCSQSELKILVAGFGSEYARLRLKYANFKGVTFIGKLDSVDKIKWCRHARVGLAIYNRADFNGHITNKLSEYHALGLIPITLGDSIFLEDREVVFGFESIHELPALIYSQRLRWNSTEILRDSNSFKRMLAVAKNDF